MEVTSLCAVTTTPKNSPSQTTSYSLTQQTAESLLIVDDDANFRMLLRHALKSQSYTICEAGSGEEALHMVARHRPKIILLDICLPGMDGIALLQQIRQQQRDEVIFMTSGLSSRDWIQTAQEHGANGFFPKPFDLQELRRAIRAI